ncbi:MAG TPA: undecaprenyl-phosphate galactose phosphotransferase WbaP [Rhizomicrobium sp.]|nr:undecaprenyl-phosphate galactose phosphotransferase WbaP [Rhizomicrobium sp.]
MTITSISDSWDSDRRKNTGHFAYWLSLFGLAASDGLCFTLASLLFRHGHSVPSLLIMNGGAAGNARSPIDIFLILAIAFVLVRYLTGDYGRRQLFWDGTKLTTIALMVTAIPDVAMLFLARGHFDILHVLAGWLFLIFAVPVMRQGARMLLSLPGFWQIPTVMIGAGARTAEIHDGLKHSLSLGFDVRWLVLDSPEATLPPSMASLRAVHSDDSARTALVMRNAGCKQAIVSAEDVQSTHFAQVVQRLLEVNIPVAIIPAFTRLPLAGVTTSYFFGRDILMLQVRSNVQRLLWRIVKRSFDIAGSLAMLIILSPLFVILAIAIKRSSPGPISYSQTRVGRHGVPFKCIKLRTMVSDAEEALRRWSLENPCLYEEYLKTFKLKDDPRITPIGKWLRRTSLDELPQLWNVLRGNMSLVGPRPVVARELEEYYGPAAQLYMRTRPGMTGLWQVSGRSDTSYERRIILDEWYILNWSFWYDIVILVQTAWIVLSGKGAV